MITTILFDFFGTVVRPVDWPETPAAVLERWGYPPDDGVKRRWHAEAAAGLEHSTASVGRATYVAWERHRLATAATASGVPAAQLDRVVDEMFAARAPRRVEPYPECSAALAVLRAKGLRLGLCSNWDWDLAELVEASGLHGAFDVVISSAHAGSRKPHPGIYAYAARQCGATASEVLFVGDTLHADVIGPLAAGMRAALVERVEPAVWIGLGGGLPKANGSALPPGVALIHDLTGVPALLNQPVEMNRPAL